MRTDAHFARVLAERMHFGQVDKAGAPYIEHLEHVARLVKSRQAEHGDFPDTLLLDVIAAAWLHDIIEDTAITAGVLEKLGFSANVIKAVVLLTRIPQVETYADYIETIIVSRNPVALAVKRADLVDHLGPNCPANLRPRYEAALARIMEAQS